MAHDNPGTTQDTSPGRYGPWQLWLIILFVLAVVSFHLFGHYIVVLALGRIYTPPALTREKAAVYTRFIGFTHAHPEYGEVFLNDIGMLRLAGESFELRTPDHLREVGQKTGFTRDEVAKLAGIYRDFRRVGCVWAQKEMWYIMFWPSPTYILPTAPGLLYSLDGRNPNDVDDKSLLNSMKPFVQIRDRWYTSRSIAVCPFPREGGQWYTPKGLIDHSLRDPGPIAGDN